MGRSDILERLQNQAANLPIEFVINPDHATLNHWYAAASLYWHAAGFGVNEELNPEHVEHFGIATTEAMSAGAVPLVYQAGGQPEIVNENHNGHLWITTDQLVAKTAHLIADPVKRGKLAEEARKTSKKFTFEEFIHAFTNIAIR
jgi:glycosyltransferase involved in cell wall biosynthesis